MSTSSRTTPHIGLSRGITRTYPRAKIIEAEKKKWFHVMNQSYQKTIDVLVHKRSFEDTDEEFDEKLFDEAEDWLEDWAKCGDQSLGKEIFCRYITPLSARQVFITENEPVRQNNKTSEGFDWFIFWDAEEDERDELCTYVRDYLRCHQQIRCAGHLHAEGYDANKENWTKGGAGSRPYKKRKVDEIDEKGKESEDSNNLKNSMVIDLTEDEEDQMDN